MAFPSSSPSQARSNGLGQEGTHGAGAFRDEHELEEPADYRNLVVPAFEAPFGVPTADHSGVGSTTPVEPELIGENHSAVHRGDVIAQGEEEALSDDVAQGAEAFLVSMETIGDGADEAVAAEDWIEATCAMMQPLEELDGASR